MATLYGKGVWLLYSQNVNLAIKMAGAIGATHILYKTGHRAMFFLDAARRVHDAVRAAGLSPFGWSFIHCDDPAGEAQVAIKSFKMGYEGFVFDVEEQAMGRATGAAELGRRLLDAGLDSHKLYYTSFPNISDHDTIPYRQMNEFCQGGMMPQSYPTLQQPAETVIHKMTYEEHARWSELWSYSPPLYPILAGYRDEQGTEPLPPEQFLLWANALSEHRPTFFSVYQAATTHRDLWPILAAMQVPEPPPEKPPPAEALTVAAPPTSPRHPPSSAEQAVYVVVGRDDTFWGLCDKYGCTKEQFWRWNGHLWDVHGLPRDPNYMQDGWRVRVK